MNRYPPISVSTRFAKKVGQIQQKRFSEKTVQGMKVLQTNKFTFTFIILVGIRATSSQIPVKPIRNLQLTKPSNGHSPKTPKLKLKKYLIILNFLPELKIEMSAPEVRLITIMSL